MPTDFLEKTLEDIIMGNPEKCVERGFPAFYKNIKRQVRLPSAGIVDIMSWEIFDNELSVNIIELKKSEISISTYTQVIQYGVDVLKATHSAFEKVNVQLYVVGSEISSDALNILSWGVNIHNVCYVYDYDGIRFTTTKANDPIYDSEFLIHFPIKDFRFVEKIKSGDL